MTAPPSRHPEFRALTTDPSSPNFVPPEERFATFDQDGTTWVEHPMYTQFVFAFERVVALAPQHPEWKTTEPFKIVLTGDKAAMAKFTDKDLETIFAGHSYRHDRRGISADREGLAGQREGHALASSLH